MKIIVAALVTKTIPQSKIQPSFPIMPNAWLSGLLSLLFYVTKCNGYFELSLACRLKTGVKSSPSSV